MENAPVIFLPKNAIMQYEFHLSSSSFAFPVIRFL